MKKLKLLSLFAGIGGFELGLERSGGFETVAQCEIEEYPRKILAKHWPEAKRYEDVRTLNATTLRRDGISVDAICGGFPCQDISTAGTGAGIEGERSGLWTEYARLIGELRPKLVFVENVAALLGRGLDKVLGDLAALGYDAEWHCIPASAVGAPHRRDRLWIIAYTNSSFSRRLPIGTSQAFSSSSVSNSQLANTASERCGEARKSCKRSKEWTAGSSSALADSERHGCNEVEPSEFSGENGEKTASQIIDSSFTRGWKGWQPEPQLGRVADGVPNRTHRLKALGNAVVPQIPELIGKAVIEGMPELFK